MNPLAFDIALILTGMAGGVAMWTPIYLHMKRQIPKRGNGGKFVSKHRATRDPMTEKLRGELGL